MQNALTAREKECLRLAASGMQAKETADGLGIKVETVNIHLSNARKKLGAQNTVHAVSRAYELGIFQMDIAGARPRLHGCALPGDGAPDEYGDVNVRTNKPAAGEAREIKVSARGGMKLRIIKKLTFRYIAVLLALGALAIASQIVMVWVIGENRSDGALVNVSGRQRMLSHQVALYAEHLAENKNAERSGELREKLLNSINRLKSSHESLLETYHNSKTNESMSDELKSLFFGPKGFLDREIKLFISHAVNFAFTPDNNVSPENQDLQYLLHSAPGIILESIDKVVDQYQQESEQHFQLLKNIQTLFFVSGMAVLFISAAAVFRPMTRRIEAELNAREKAEKEEHAAREKAELANRAKTEFLANTSHELRTPLNSIIGFSEAMLAGVFGPLGNAAYVEYANDIKNSGDHLLAVINDILDVSRIEANELALNECELDTNKLLEACRRLIKQRAEKAGLKLIVEKSAPRRRLYADERRIKQILINLLSNAVKFTPQGGTVTLKAINGDGRLTFRISDTGIGIASDDIKKVMKPFVQVDSSLARKYDGTGLGLSLSKSLIELHGGALTLESELGVGTTVNVIFPQERVVVS